MDDLTKIILTAAGTLAVAVVAALVGAWVQSRRERDKWLREQRLDAYTTFIRRALAIHRRMGMMPVPVEEWIDHYDTIARLHLLGDSRTLAAAYAVRDALHAGKDDNGRTPATEAGGVAIDNFAEAARKALGVEL